jgi:phosphoribosylformylglycinamidine synthase PurS subunit|tara:strand:- start:1060 stop:1320 length:261 start_codon:yes stop_codon:yes gene_type:complete
MRVEITTRYRPGVKDIQGMTVQSVFSRDLGYPEVSEVWIGQLYELEYPDHLGVEYADSMCKKQLVNTVLYEYKIKIVDEFGEGFIR